MAFPQSVLLATRRTDILFRTSVLELIVLVVCSGLCIWQWGLAGAGLASLAGNLFEKTTLAWRLAQTGIPPRQYIHLASFGTAILVVLLAFFVKYSGHYVYM
jgi:O-antigen/teichoic acid export membrane protein